MNKDGLKNGLTAGFIGTLCCTLPLAIIILAVFFGIGSVSLGLYIGYYGELFFILALVFLVISTYFYLKRKSCCDIKGVKQNWKMILISIVIMTVTYALVKFFLIPYLSYAILGGGQ